MLGHLGFKCTKGIPVVKIIILEYAAHNIHFQIFITGFFFLYFDCILQIPTLIHELLAVELWKEKVFPKLLESGYNPHTTLPVYFVVGVT